MAGAHYGDDSRAGRLPELLVERARAAGTALLICGYAEAPGSIEPDIPFHLERLGGLVRGGFSGRGVKETRDADPVSPAACARSSATIPSMSRAATVRRWA